MEAGVVWSPAVLGSFVQHASVCPNSQIFSPVLDLALPDQLGCLVYPIEGDGVILCFVVPDVVHQPLPISFPSTETAYSALMRSILWTGSVTRKQLASCSEKIKTSERGQGVDEAPGIIDIWEVDADPTYRAMPCGLMKLKHNLGIDGVRVGICVVQPTLPKSLNEL